MKTAPAPRPSGTGRTAKELCHACSGRDTDDDAEAELEELAGRGLDSMPDAMSQKSPSEVGSQRSSKPGKPSKPSVGSHGTRGDLSPLDELSASATQARTEMVHKVLERLREEAFELARDIGVDVLSSSYPRGASSTQASACTDSRISRRPQVRPLTVKRR